MSSAQKVIRNNVGHITHPCGTPPLTEHVLEYKSEQRRRYNISSVPLHSNARDFCLFILLDLPEEISKEQMNELGISEGSIH